MCQECTGQSIRVQGATRALAVPDHALGVLERHLSSLVRLQKVGGGDSLPDAPPGAEVPEGGGGEDAGPVTGEGLCYSEGGKVSPEDIDELNRGVTFEV